MLVFCVTRVYIYPPALASLGLQLLFLLAVRAVALPWGMGFVVQNLRVGENGSKPFIGALLLYLSCHSTHEEVYN